MQNRALKARVDRLLGGDYRPEDLTHIFLALRSSSYGRESIRELGDFVAHNRQIAAYKLGMRNRINSAGKTSSA
jgi:hypothetical protein